MNAEYAFRKAPIRVFLSRIPITLFKRVEDFVQKQHGRGSEGLPTSDVARIVVDFAKSPPIKRGVYFRCYVNDIRADTSRLSPSRPSLLKSYYQRGENFWISNSMAGNLNGN
jgi:hypothetical protein